MMFYYSGNESDESEGNSEESDLEALKKLSLPTNSDISSVADVIEQATKQSKHKVSQNYEVKHEHKNDKCNLRYPILL